MRGVVVDVGVAVALGVDVGGGVVVGGNWSESRRRWLLPSRVASMSS